MASFHIFFLDADQFRKSGLVVGLTVPGLFDEHSVLDFTRLHSPDRPQYDTQIKHTGQDRVPPGFFCPLVGYPQISFLAMY